MVDSHEFATCDPATALQALMHRANQATNTAAKRVFLTTELLELILLQLPRKDVFSSSRVSRFWTDCIKRSSILQLHLYPADHAPEQWYIDHDALILRRVSETEIEHARMPRTHPILGVYVPALPCQWNRLVIVNEMLFDKTRFRGVFANRYKDSEAHFSIDFAKLSQSSSCLDTLLYSGGSDIEEMVIEGSDKGETEAQRKIYEMRLTKASSGMRFRQLWEFLTVPSNDWRNDLHTSFDLEKPISIRLKGAVHVSRRFLGSIHGAGRWRQPMIARSEGAVILQKTLPYLDLVHKLHCRMTSQQMRDAVDRFWTGSETSKSDPNRFWIVEFGSTVVRVVEVGQSIASNDHALAQLASLLRTYNDSPGAQGHHYGLFRVAVYNEAVLERHASQSLEAQVYQGYTELTLRAGMSRYSDQIESPLRVTQSVSSCAHMPLSTPAPRSVMIEMLHHDSDATWHEANLSTTFAATHGSTPLLVGSLMDQIARAGCTARIRLPGIVAVTADKWAWSGRQQRLELEDLHQNLAALCTRGESEEMDSDELGSFLMRMIR